MDDGDRTIAAYDDRVDAYLAARPATPPEAVVAWLQRFAGLVPGPRVLEIGSGPGDDADLLEGHGLRVQRSDASRAFVDRLRGLGHDALLLDLRRDPLPGGFDGVLADAVLLHLERDELDRALRAICDALVPGGVLAYSLKEGDGETWSERKLGVPRRFVLWREPALRAALERAGLVAIEVQRVEGRADRWLQVLARRPPDPAETAAR